MAAVNSPWPRWDMSNRWYYDIDGRIGGPITPMQLQLMVNSGMLAPHHKIRREEATAWTIAGSVRGLFLDTSAPANGIPQGIPVGVPKPAAAQFIQDDPFAVMMRIPQ